jgi:tRNA uridine 5-carboxymethylaminomethyl modification enzyme
MIQFRMLNLSKGPAMWSPRAQSDRQLFSLEWRKILEENLNVSFFQDSVVDIITENEEIKGVKTQLGFDFYADAVVLTSGTFLNGLIHIGTKQMGGGRMGDRASYGITESLEKLGFESGRMKTGTPPRVDGRSLNWDLMEEQPGDLNPGKFSYTNTPHLTKQRSCYITYTNTNVHDVLREGFEDSPMFNGTIKSLGPRYCPSIEDKINRFAERDRHQIFVEPEGWDTVEIYVNGFSTSLPEKIQIKALEQIPGFENVKIFRPGYAIEYDFFPPTQLKRTLETKIIAGLYFAGQINGTTGYEEAACQGLMAGINAHLKIKEKEPLILDRSEAYIGVLIDDLINKGTEEPYRMFTSRAEFRILLRQDNADSRLTRIGHKIGLAEDSRLITLDKKEKNIETISNYIKNTSLDPIEINPILEENNSSPIPQKYKMAQILSRPHISLSSLKALPELNEYLSQFNTDEQEAAEILIKYEGYIEKEKEQVDKTKKLEHIVLRPDFNYHDIKSLSNEGREKLTKIKPETIGQATRISGVSPADISILLVHFGR